MWWAYAFKRAFRPIHCENVAAKRCFQVALELFGDEGDQLDVNCTFAVIQQQMSWAHRGCRMVHIYPENQYMYFYWGQPLSAGQRLPASTAGGRSPSGPSGGSCFSAAALPLGLASATAPVQPPPCLCLATGPLVRPRPQCPTCNWLPGPPWASPWPWPSPGSPGDMPHHHGLGRWPGPSAAILGLPHSPGCGAGPCPTGSPRSGLPFSLQQTAHAAPGHLRLVFCKISSWGSSRPMAVVKQQGLKGWCSHSACVYGFSGFDIGSWHCQPWNFTYRIMKIKSLTVLHWEDLKKLIFHRGEKKNSIDECC